MEETNNLLELIAVILVIIGMERCSSVQIKYKYIQSVAYSILYIAILVYLIVWV